MVAGVNGQPGVPADLPVGRDPVPGRGNVIPPPLLTAGNPVLDQKRRERLAAIILAIPKVRISDLNI